MASPRPERRAAPRAGGTRRGARPRLRVLALGEGLGVSALPELAAALATAAASTAPLVLDFEGATGAHGAALQLLVAGVRLLRSRGVAVQWEGLSPELAELLRISGLAAELRTSLEAAGVAA